MSSITYSPLFNEQKAIQLRNQQYQIIKEAKRRLLHFFLYTYEINLQEYEQQYQEVLKELENELFKNTSIQGVILLNNINQYMVYRTNQLKQDISNKVITFRNKLLKNRKQSSSTKSMISVSPEPYLDLNFNPFNVLERHHLSFGTIFISIFEYFAFFLS